jgi:hypothetical protein
MLGRRLFMVHGLCGRQYLLHGSGSAASLGISVPKEMT